MATITKSIGTSSRDYSTITLWEADLDTGSIYSSGDDAVGECYNDSVFTAGATIDGGGTVGLNSVKLTVADGNKHDGTAGTGTRFLSSANYSAISSGVNSQATISYLEMDLNSGNNYFNGTLYGNGAVYHGLLIYNVNLYNHLFYYDYRRMNVYNNIVYNGTGYRGKSVIRTTSSGGTSYITNNTIYNFSGTNTGFYVRRDPTFCKNNIAIDISSCFVYVDTPTQVGYNMSSDTSAGSFPNSLTNQNASGQFVSIVGGAEDIHLKSSSEAIGAGVDLGASPDGIQYDINGSNRDALTATVWDMGAHQYASTASIGTSSRDYSTITLWEADLDDTTVYGAGANAVGECYNDAAFVESFALNGGSTLGLSSVLLKPASGEGHDGTADTGVKVESYAYGQAKWSNTTSIPSEIRQIDFKRQHNSEQHMISLTNLNSVINRCIIRNVSGSPFRSHINTGFGGGSVYNSILYGYTMKYGIEFQSLYNGFCNIINNTIFAATNATACIYGRNRNGAADTSIFKNNLLITQGSAVAYDPASTVPSSFADNKNNMTNYSSFPSTHFDSSSITNADSSKQFVSTLSGSEDLHLIFKSAAIDAGVDLGTSPDGVQYDINGKNRDAEGSIWDIGAHEYGDNVIFGLLRV